MDMTGAEGRTIHVRLSRRNLVALLTKIDHPESYRTISRVTDAGMLVVTSEKDADHYRERTPGEMVDFTEEDIDRWHDRHETPRAVAQPEAVVRADLGQKE